ncbi:MAG: LuxR C-terminal-related transcriptional regulator [Flavobacteriaceae bacterium]|nr:LuxR C-terminal-related transcriptional regulator [Flavobacteriaceae bacterium]
MTENGQIKCSLNKFTDISFIDSSKNVDRRIKAKNLNKNAFKYQIYKVYQGFFTIRETEIIIETEKGSTSKQIAENLNISKHTATTLRKKYPKKTNYHNTKNLILFCKGTGII